ncbi:hypothetical protein N136_01183 [Leifsonia aquatica ATCC 14665]|uniref:Uncharacterized protein n=1 Tax=Leifsonia aquatica ATCC 14665 TaxID=1358026 RepID=U2RB50_LEIAQ|nr:hypothetical protein N136_01183 [Leifsonia aquatica ATCC 14665]
MLPSLYAGAPRRWNEKDPPRTRQSPVTLAAFPPWGSWPGWRHVGSRRTV